MKTIKTDVLACPVCYAGLAAEFAAARTSLLLLSISIFSGCCTPNQHLTQSVDRAAQVSTVPTRERKAEIGDAPEWMQQKVIALHQLAGYDKMYSRFYSCKYHTDRQGFSALFTNLNASKGVSYSFDSEGRLRTFVVLICIY